MSEPVASAVPPWVDVEFTCHRCFARWQLVAADQCEHSGGEYYAVACPELRAGEPSARACYTSSAGDRRRMKRRGRRRRIPPYKAKLKQQVIGSARAFSNAFAVAHELRAIREHVAKPQRQLELL